MTLSILSAGHVGVLRALPLDVPVDPDVDQARDWVVQELSKPEYRAAQPSWFDRLASAFWDWLTSLTLPGQNSPWLLWGVVALVVIAALVGIYFAFGPPRINRRAAAVGALFGIDDPRDAAALRRSARDAASASDFTLAIEELFRAIARGLAERAIVDTYPGTTATGFATRAAAHFPSRRAALDASAADFDAVRYLGRSGTADAFERMSALDADLERATPELIAPDGIVVVPA